MQIVPFIHCLILNGSLAQGRAKSGSDIDILIIARDGRIFTVRFFVLLLATLLGVKRSSDDVKSHAGKFCFNYFMTASYLRIPTSRGAAMDRYCAENYSRSVLVWGDEKIFRRFFDRNEKLFQCQKRKSQVHMLNIKKLFPIGTVAVRAIGIIGEAILKGRLGDWVEGVFKKVQVRRIERDPRTRQYSDLIVYNDQELRFHPPKIC